MRDERLNETLFTSVVHARFVLVAWRHDYIAARRPFPGDIAARGGGLDSKLDGKTSAEIANHQTTIMKAPDPTFDW